MSEPVRHLRVTAPWCLAGVAVAVALWDGPPDPGQPLRSRIASDPTAQDWPAQMQGVVLRPRHSPFP